MLDFHSITLDDKLWAEKILAQSDFRGAEYSFVNNFVWQRYFKTTCCKYGGFYLLKSELDGLSFSFPSGSGDYRELFSALADYASSRGFPLVITSVTDALLPIFEELYGGKYTVSSNESSSDYIYSAEKMCTFSGKKLHGKRNHLTNFKKSYNYSYSTITEKDFDDCIVLAAQTYNENGGYESGSAVNEQYVIHRLFDNYGALGLSGGIIRADGKTVAFTLGNKLNSDTLDVNIEKADTSFNGAYTAICNEFAKSECEKYSFRYINREEDMGIEGLRRSKLSYYPEFLLKKNTVTFM